MLAKKFSQQTLRYVLYSYCIFIQEPILDAFSHERIPYMINLDDYKTELMKGLNSAWTLAQDIIYLAQQ